MQLEEQFDQYPEHIPGIEELIDLNLLGNKKHPYFKVEVEKLEKNLKKNGFCFLILPYQLQQASKDLINASKGVLGKVPWNEKEKYFAAPSFGYCDKGKKQSLTFLTGQFLNQENDLQKICPPLKLDQNQEINKNLPESVKSVSALFDSASKYIFQNVPCFQKIAQNGQEQIPLLRKRVPQFGMLDVVRYQGGSGYTVDSHVDPGIFSISVHSSESGLQLRNSDGKWIQAPYKDQMYGIIWNGLGANKLSNGELAQGWHRVAPSQNDRFTMWYECVVESQIADKIQNIGILAMKDENSIYLGHEGQKEKKNIKEENKIILDVEAQNGRKFNMVLDREKDTIGSLKFGMENLTGLRPSKSAMPMRVRDDEKIGNVFKNKNANLNMKIGNNSNKLSNNSNSLMKPANNSNNSFQQQQQPQNQNQNVSLKPMQMNGYKKKQATDSQYQEMTSHVQNCNHKQCLSVWQGNWGPFIGGDKGSQYFDLTDCVQGRKLNEAIYWNYNDPNN